MKKKISTLKLGSIKELSRAEQKSIKGGGGPSSPCCPSNPYYNPSACLTGYSPAMTNGRCHTTGSSIWCDPSWDYSNPPVC